MLLWLLDWLATSFSFEPGSLGKITLRASLAAVLSFVVGITFGPWIVGWLSSRFREPNRSPSPKIEALHREKSDTPTMGGLFILLGVAASVLIFADLSNAFIQLMLLLGVGLTALGAVDDLRKLSGRSSGLSALSKLVCQTTIATVVAVLAYNIHSGAPGGLGLNIPGAAVSFDLGIWFIPLAVLVIVGSSNAVNLTDGLDGLAGGCLIFAVCGMGAAVYIAGHAQLAAYMGVALVPGSGETLVLAGGLAGGLLGFLWFNCHPAQVFMGDTGSLPLGGLLGLLAVCARQELVLLIVAGVFVLEAGSVILQIGYFKLRRRRLFLCAPLHHHFQLRGWPENRIVVRFWIASALCALIGVASLKLHVRESDNSTVGPAALTATAPTERLR